MFKNEEGFSLLELVVAVGVAGIIAAVALPTFAGIQDKATTTSATYAASASAAEALANATMGLTGSTGLASSSAAASSNATSGPTVSLSGSDFITSGFVGIMSESQPAVNSSLNIGDSTQSWPYSEGLYENTNRIELLVSAGTAEAIKSAVTAGATTVTLNGNTYSLTSNKFAVWNSTVGAYVVEFGPVYYTIGGYGGARIVLYVSNTLPNENNYYTGWLPTSFTI